MKIAIVGAGYVGLVTGACLADFGHTVVCVDSDLSKIEKLNGGEIPIFEPGLSEIVAQNIAAGRLAFTTKLSEAAERAEVVFIAVGTPTRRGEAAADLSFVFAAAEEIAGLVQDGLVIAVKSTVPVGTGDKVEAIVKRHSSARMYVVSNPEFLREGAAIDDFKRPDRVVIGTLDPEAQAVMKEVYRPLFLNETPIVFTSRRTSELAKYAANAFLAMKVAFINEVSDLCETIGADVQHVSKCIGLDKRIAPKFLHAGPGFGGSCFPKDILALNATAHDVGVPLSLVQATIDANARRKKNMAEKIIAAVGGVEGKTIGVLGLTFKPRTDDMRESPSLVILPALQAAGATVRAYDPEGMGHARAMLPGTLFCSNEYDVAEGSDALVILTEWDQFRALDLARLRGLLRSPTIIDLRNIYDPGVVRAQGFTYVSVGR